MIRRLILGLAVLAAAIGGAGAGAAPALRVERVVIVMRHGIRPPLKMPPLPAGVADRAWPDWPVPPGRLTPHGAAAIRLLAGWYRDDLAAAALFAPAGCPASGAVRIVADSDQRTIATGEAFAAGFAPGCPLAVQHVAEGTPDRLFHPIETGTTPFDPARARAAIEAEAGNGGVAGVAADQRSALASIGATLGCCDTALCRHYALRAPCTLPDLPSVLVLDGRKEPKLGGALKLGATAAEVLLLEYLEGLPMPDVGFGRADRAQVLADLALHPAEFDLLHRPPYTAARGATAILQRVAAAMGDSASATKLTVLVGHDTTLAYLGGALGVHWQTGDYPRDDPPPGGALGFERLRDRAGRAYVRLFFAVQSPEQMRDLSPLGGRSPPPLRADLPIPGCARLCPVARFRRIVARVTAPSEPRRTAARAPTAG